MEDSSKRFVSRSVFPVWQLVQVSRTFVCTFKSYFHQTLEPSNFFSRVNIQKLLRICLPFKPFLSCSMNSNDLSFTNWLTVFRLFFFFPHSFLIHNVARARTLLSFPVTIFFFIWKLASDCSGSIYFRENTCKQINLFRFQVTWCVFLSHF